MSTKKIGIMGGTFNPVHLGHLIMAESAKEEFGLDKVLFIPAKAPYHKSNSSLLPEDIRLKMTYEAIKDNDGFEVSDIEIKRNDESTFTIDTLRQLEGEGSLYLIIGQDSLEYIEKWKESDEIFKRATILAAGRIRNYTSEQDQSEIKNVKSEQSQAATNFETSGQSKTGMNLETYKATSKARMDLSAERLRKEYGARVEFIKMPYVDISSTMIRERFVSGGSVRYFVNESVRRFLEEYRSEVLKYWYRG